MKLVGLEYTSSLKVNAIRLGNNIYNIKENNFYRVSHETWQ